MTTEAERALTLLEAEHPTGQIAVGSSTHGGPPQYAKGCRLHGAWCPIWPGRQKALDALRAVIAATGEAHITEDCDAEATSVMEAMVRAASRAFWDGNPQFMTEHADDMRAALQAALTVRDA